MKIKRPAKLNKDGSKTLRLYCTHHNAHYTQDDINMISMNSGLKEETCFFGLTFRFLPTVKLWVLYDCFERNKFFHSHPFYYQTTALAEELSIGLQEAPKVKQED